VKTSKTGKQYTSGVRPLLKNVACLSSLISAESCVLVCFLRDLGISFPYCPLGQPFIGESQINYIVF